MKRSVSPSGSAGNDTKRTRCDSFCNDLDPISLAPLAQIPEESLVRFFDVDGVWAVARESLQSIITHSALEGVEPLNPFNGEPLRAFSGLLQPHSLEKMTDALREQEYPTHASTRQLAVDVAVRLQERGVFIKPELLWEQRTGRMRRIFSALDQIFHNFTVQERNELAPPDGRLAHALPGWDTWPRWGQTTLLAMLRFSGERSRASPVLKKRAAEYCFAALALVIPEVHREVRDSIDMSGTRWQPR